MAELTTDQVLSALLAPLLAQMQEQSVTSNRNAEAFRTNGKLDAASVHETLEQRADDQVERLVDLIEALAAGMVRIVDERLLNSAVAEAMRHAFREGLTAEDPSRTFDGDAAEVLATAAKMGALR